MRKASIRGIMLLFSVSIIGHFCWTAWRCNFILGLFKLSVLLYFGSAIVVCCNPHCWHRAVYWPLSLVPVTHNLGYEWRTVPLVPLDHYLITTFILTVFSFPAAHACQKKAFQRGYRFFGRETCLRTRTRSLVSCQSSMQRAGILVDARNICP